MFSGGDYHSEMTLPQQLFRGLDTADFVELSAPTPWLIQATEQDYFTPPGAKLVYEEARRRYDEELLAFIDPEAINLDDDEDERSDLDG